MIINILFYSYATHYTGVTSPINVQQCYDSPSVGLQRQPSYRWYAVYTTVRIVR